MPATSVNIIDLVFTGSLITWLSDDFGQPVTFDYSTLLAGLGRIRDVHGYRESEGAFAPAAVDLDSHRQRSFTDALARRGMAVERIDYRHAYVSHPIERSMNEEAPRGPTEDDKRPRLPNPLSVAPSMAYLLGMLATREKPEALIVTASFDLYHPLLDFIENRGGRAGIVWFRGALDRRWIVNNVFETGQIEFYDLTEASGDILGIDLNDALRKRHVKQEQSGFKAF